MLLTQNVKYYSKEIPVTELNDCSEKKVLVACPVCEQERYVFWKYRLKAKSDICHACANYNNKKTLPIGNKFGRLTILGTKRVGYSICECECNKIIEVDNYNLKIGHTKSCGCIKRDNFENAEICKNYKHGNWKGGISGLRGRMMATKKYKTWRTSIYERDKYTCQKCMQIGYELNVHHIESYAEHENKRCEINNGITLCRKCHLKFHRIYGRKNINKKQLDEFLTLT